MRRSGKSWTTVVAAAALAAAIPAAASADTYSVYSCRTPAGTVAARDGWVPFQVAGASTATDTCAANGALMGNMAPSAAGNSASWTVAAPPGLPITGYVLYRWAQVTNVAPVASGPGYQYIYQLLEDGTAAEALAPVYGTGANWARRPRPWLTAMLWCAPDFASARFRRA